MAALLRFVLRKRFFTAGLVEPFGAAVELAEVEATEVTAHPAVIDWFRDDGPFILP